MIEARELTKRYGTTTALQPLTITIPLGGLTALVGPNGAGKSTLLRLCIGFERPSSGSLHVLGIDPVQKRTQAIGRIGYVPQRTALYRQLSVEEHLALAQSMRAGFDPEHARNRLAELAIDPAARPRELSGGQQAQVMLAIALATRAPVLLLDEPLASLDPLARREFLEVVRAAVRGGDVSAVLSSHVLSEIDDVADHVLVLGSGKILFFDAVSTSIAEHRTVEDTSADLKDVIGRFPGRRGKVFALVHARSGVGRHPALEEVVLGYLASERANQIEGWPAAPEGT